MDYINRIDILERNDRAISRMEFNKVAANIFLKE